MRSASFSKLILSVLLLSLTAVPSSAQLQKNDLTFRASPVASFLVGPEQLSNNFSTGRGLNAGLGVFINSSLELEAQIEFTRYGLKDPSTSGFLTGTNDAVRFSTGLGIKWTTSKGESFRTYLRGTGNMSRYALGQTSELATGFDLGIGLLFPTSYTTAIFAEPVYTVEYLPTSTVQSFNVRLGLLLGEF